MSCNNLAILVLLGWAPDNAARMEKVVLALLIATFLSSSCKALKCMHCYASGSFENCDIKGYIQECQPNQESCETVVRRYRDYLWIKKGCKDKNACHNNQLQNAARSGKSRQCNSDQTNSFCSCCCDDKDLCNAGSPTCVPHYQAAKQECPSLRSKFPHGEMECYNDGNVCEYKCTQEGYDVWPKGRYTNVCRDNGTWAHETPCCSRPCPPYYLIDDVKIIHFRRENAQKRWDSFLRTFVYGVIAEDAMKHALFYFNEEPVESSVVNFNDYGENATKYMELVRERIKIDNTVSGRVNLGAAIQYALDNILTTEKGMRYEKVPKAIGIMTNANPDDDVKGPSEEARRRGILMYVIGTQLDEGFKFDRKKLLEITGDERRIWIFDREFGEHSDYDNMDEYYCPNPCDHIMHDHQ